MLAQSDGRFTPVDVEVGIEDNGQSEIRKGLQPGQKVVVSGQFLLDSEASLKASTTRMAEMPGAQPPAAATHRGEGQIESIGEDEVMISHGPIPSMQWGPMTMGFKTPSGPPAGISAGQSVNFEFRLRNDGSFEIVSITPAPAKSTQGAIR